MGNMSMNTDVFKEEALELLAELETSLLELEETPEDKEAIGRAFRALHTIKGSAGMYGFDPIADFTHEVERRSSIRSGMGISPLPGSLWI